MRTRLLRRAEMKSTFQVVDDFYADPTKVRRLAIEHGKWLEPKVSNGLTYDFETDNSFYSHGLVEEFSRLLNRPILVDPARMGFGVFSLTGKDANAQFTTHFDDTDWAAIVYLVPNEMCFGGLSFFRHRGSGLTGPPSDEEAARLGFPSRADWLIAVYYPDKLRPDAWEEIACVGMRFNRMVLVRGSENFHRATAGFGRTLTDGRLTQRFFFMDGDEHHAQ
ncbi:MAG: DUF6445 family protein [Nocardioides sp.]